MLEVGDGGTEGLWGPKVKRNVESDIYMLTVLAITLCPSRRPQCKSTVMLACP